MKYALALSEHAPHETITPLSPAFWTPNARCWFDPLPYPLDFSLNYVRLLAKITSKINNCQNKKTTMSPTYIQGLELHKVL